MTPEQEARLRERYKELHMMNIALEDEYREYVKNGYKFPADVSDTSPDQQTIPPPSKQSN